MNSSELERGPYLDFFFLSGFEISKWTFGLGIQLHSSLHNDTTLRLNQNIHVFVMIVFPDDTVPIVKLYFRH